MRPAAQRPICPPRAAAARKTVAIFQKTILPLVLTLVSAVFAVALVLFGPAPIRSAFQNIRVSSWEALSALLTAFVLALALHELGHFIAALAMQFYILGGALGPFRYSRKRGDRKWTFSMRRVFGGAVSAVPMDDHLWRARMLAVVGAGPALTLWTGAVAVELSKKADPGSWLLIMLSSLAAINLIIFFIGLIPNGRFASARNDAQLFLGVLLNSEEAREIRLYHELTRKKIEGAEPRDYPLTLVAQLAEYEGRPDMSVAFGAAVTSWALDSGDQDTAEAWYSRVKELAGRDPNLVRIALTEMSEFLPGLPRRFRRTFWQQVPVRNR